MLSKHLLPPRNSLLRTISHSQFQILSPQTLRVNHRPHRHFSKSTNPALPRKDSQHKDSMNVEANEYSKSGTDDQAARADSTAFDPNQTDPDGQRENVGANSGSNESNPLDVSPANTEVSKQRSGTEGGSESSSASSSSTSGSDRERTSGGGSPSKGKKVS